MINNNFTLVIFGATGDLTKRKLLPALYNLEVENNLPKNIKVYAIGRRNYSQEDYSNLSKESIDKFSRIKTDNSVWEKFIPKIEYLKMDYNNESEFSILKEKIKNNQNSQIIYYLAVTPDHFELIINSLNKFGLGESKTNKPRLVIEKPFGSNLETAKCLNEKITKVFSEKNTYRIDHYLGKEMLQSIMVIRFSNAFFEPIWNSEHINKVIINSSETIGINSRGNYFENFGIIRDMVQSHLLQLMSLIAMEKPKTLEVNDVRDEKIKVLKSLKPFSELELKSNIVRGQYESYLSEENVNPNSKTETYVSIKTEIDNDRWRGVPFYIRTGKKLPRKSTEIIIEFKDTPYNLYTTAARNLLVFKIQPEEGVFLNFNAKKIGNTSELVPVKMDFCQNCEVGFNTPEAYERLLFDVMRGDATLFARWDEVEYSWKFIDTIANYWQKSNPKLFIYKDNSSGPDDNFEYLEKRDLYLDI